MLTKNEGPVDRAIRVVGGIALVAIGLFLLSGVQGSVVGLVVAAFGLWFTVTGAVGVCPAYMPFHFSTVRERQEARPIDRSHAKAA